MRQLKFHIKSIREEKGISQGQLAVMTGVSQSAISDIENNKRNPSLWTVQMISDVLGVPVDDLVEVRSDEDM